MIETKEEIVCLCSNMLTTLLPLVLVSAGAAFIFFSVADAVLGFEFSRRMMLIKL